jgi:hypothetical protein
LIGKPADIIIGLLVPESINRPTDFTNMQVIYYKIFFDIKIFFCLL